MHKQAHNVVSMEQRRHRQVSGLSPREHARRIRMERGELPEREYRSGEIRIIRDREIKGPFLWLLGGMIGLAMVGLGAAIWLAL